MLLVHASFKPYQNAGKSQREARGSKRKKDLESVTQNNCKIEKHTHFKCLWHNMRALGHSLIQNSDAYTAAECIPSHLHSSGSRFSHCSDLSIPILYKVIPAPKTQKLWRFHVFIISSSMATSVK